MSARHPRAHFLALGFTGVLVAASVTWLGLAIALDAGQAPPPLAHGVDVTVDGSTVRVVNATAPSCTRVTAAFDGHPVGRVECVPVVLTRPLRDSPVSDSDALHAWRTLHADPATSAGGGNLHRDVKLAYVDSEGRVLVTVVLEDALFTGYRVEDADAAASGAPALERFTITPTRVNVTFP